MITGWRRRRERRRTAQQADLVRPLVSLTRRFLAGEIEPAAYDARYRQAMFAADDLAEPLWGILDAQWHACEAYVDDPTLREPPDDLGPAELRSAARRTLDRLAALSPDLVSPAPRPRFAVLHDLLEQHYLSADLIDELRSLPWDGSELVLLHPRHLLHALGMRDRGTISDAELTAWAEAVGAREDVGRVDETADMVNDAIFELTNPALHPSHSPTLSADLLARLEAADRR